MVETAAGARSFGAATVICGTGMAAHLAGVVAAHTRLPVIGVPLAGHGAFWARFSCPGASPLQP